MNPAHTLSLSVGSSPCDLAHHAADLLKSMTWLRAFRQPVQPDGYRCGAQTNEIEFGLRLLAPVLETL